MAISAFHTALSHIGHVLFSSVISLLTLVSAGGYGYYPLGTIWERRTERAEELCIFAAALGYGIISFLMIAAGCFGHWTRLTAWIILVIGIFLSRPFVRAGRRFPWTAYFQQDLLSMVIFLCILWGFLLAPAPITYYDSLVYHMAMPSAYVRAGHWIALKPLVYSAFPQMTEMIWTFCLLLANDTVVSITGFILAMLTVGATACFAVRFLHKESAKPSVLLLLAMPAFLLLASGGYVDLPLTLYSFLSLYAFFEWRERMSSGPLVLSGIFAGFALSIKYTGGIPLAVIGWLVLWRSVRSFRLAVQNSAVYAGSAFLVFGPWLVKNTIYLGNPVFPFFYRWGNPKLSAWTQTAAAGYFRGVSEYQARTMLGLARLPWEIVQHSLRFGGGMDVLGDFGWAPFILLVPCLFFTQKRVRSGTRWLGAYALLFFVPWGMTRPVLRFLMPLAPVLALLAGTAWTHAVRLWKTSYRHIAYYLTGIVLAYDFFIFFYITSWIGIFPVALGLESRDAYLKSRLNYFAAAQAIDCLPHVKNVFILGDQRGYYYNRAVLVTPVFNQNPLVTWSNDASSPQALKDRLSQEGISHVLVNEIEMRRLASYGIFSFTAQGLLNWTLLETTLATLVYQDNACKIFSL